MTTTLRSKVEVQLGWTWRDRIGPFVVTDDNRLRSVKELSDGAVPPRISIESLRYQ